MAVLMTIILLGLLAYLGPNINHSNHYNNADSVIARVYGREILRRDIDLIVSGTLRKFGKDANSQELIPFLTNQALTQLVRAKLMEKLAESHGVVVTNLEIKNTLESQLKQYGFVGRDGKLLPSSEINNILLSSNGISLKWLEDSTTCDLARQKLLQQAVIQVPVDNAWLNSEIRVRNEKIEFESVTIDPNKTQVADPELSKLEKFYKESGTRFQVGPRRVIEYVFLNADAIKIAPIDDIAVKATYDSNRDKFAELRASHILFKAASNDELREAIKKAKELRVKLLAGYNFSKAAESLSQDPSVQSNKGDLGWFNVGHMQKSFENAAMALKVGEISEPVQTSFGIHLIRLDGRKERGFDQIKEELRAKLVWERFTMKAKDQLEQLRKRTGEHGDLVKTANKLGLLIKVSRPFLRDSVHSLIDIPNSQEVIKESFKVKVGTVSPVRQCQDGFMVFKVREELPTAVPSFGEVKQEVLMAWRLEEARKLTIYNAKNMLKAGNFKAFGALVAHHNTTTIASLGDLGRHPAIRKALLDTPIGQLTPMLWTSSGNLWVARIFSRVSAGTPSFADRRAIIEQIQMGVASEMLSAELEKMEKVGNKRSGLSSLYGRFNGIWYNKKALSSMYNANIAESNI
jgi:peptidyl-prolyl cis-trans isomerase D